VLPSGSQSVDLNRTYIGLTRHSVQLVLSEDHERKMVRSAGGKPLDANASLPDQRPSGSTRFATRTDPRGSNTDVRPTARRHITDAKGRGAASELMGADSVRP
jgi:hypothetical protein